MFDGRIYNAEDFIKKAVSPPQSIKKFYVYAHGKYFSISKTEATALIKTGNMENHFVTYTVDGSNCYLQVTK